MNGHIYSLNLPDLNHIDNTQQQSALNALESGQVLYFPEYFFTMPELIKTEVLSESILDGKHKNISFDCKTGRIGGFNKKHRNQDLSILLKTFMQAYAQFSRQLIDTLLPQYQESLQWGRTSYRPAEISGRASSKRKDDTRLHVDSFASTPVHGLRILRVFCNINPYGEPRVWHLGEPFTQVLEQFSPSIPDFKPAIAKFLHLIKATKTERSAYDHYQLQLHDRMKLDDTYQKNVPKYRMDFPAQSTWIVFTDNVSHAALSGQFLLEQTFYLPVNAMASAELSPFRQWVDIKNAVMSEMV